MQQDLADAAARGHGAGMLAGGAAALRAYIVPVFFIFPIAFTLNRLGQHYDIVVNGVELGGGSIRIHQPDVQKTVFEEVLQIPPDMVAARFGYMLEAFKYGAPPHGGIALGFDRLIAILCGTPSIRDVIAFPKTAKGTCLMTESPSAVSAASWVWAVVVQDTNPRKFWLMENLLIFPTLF